jgi:uncharacterized membrane protein
MVYGFAGRSGGSARIYSELGKGTMICLCVQRRLAPWIGAITWILAFSGVVVAPASRAAIGWATADILSLLLDLAAVVVSLLMIVRHWRTVRSLIVKRGRTARTTQRSALHCAISSIGNRWHLLAYTFLALNIGGRLIGRARQLH